MVNPEPSRPNAVTVAMVTDDSSVGVIDAAHPTSHSTGAMAEGSACAVSPRSAARHNTKASLIFFACGPPAPAIIHEP